MIKNLGMTIESFHVWKYTKFGESQDANAKFLFSSGRYYCKSIPTERAFWWGTLGCNHSVMCIIVLKYVI